MSEGSRRQLVTSPAAVAVVTLLLSAVHARWHDESYHGYELHEAAPHYHDPSHRLPLGKGYQRIHYHLARASGSEEFQEQFPPLYHGEVSLPPDYPRSVRQKRQAPPQQDTDPQGARVSSSSLKNLAPVAERVAVSELRPETANWHGKHSSSQAGEQGTRRVGGALDEAELRLIKDNSTEDAAASSTKFRQSARSDAVSKHATLLEIHSPEQRREYGAGASDGPDPKKRLDASASQLIAKNTRYSSKHLLAEEAVPVAAVRPSRAGPAPVQQARNRPVGWLGSHELSFFRDVPALAQQRRKNEGAGANFRAKQGDKKVPTKRFYRRKTQFVAKHYTLHNNEGLHRNGVVDTRRGVQTNAHTGHRHARHGYGNIADILGDFFRQPVRQTSFKGIQQSNSSRNNSHITTESIDVLSSSDTHSLAAGRPAEHRVGEDFHTTRESNQLHDHFPDHKIDRLPAPVEVTSQVKETELLDKKLSGTGSSPVVTGRHDGDGRLNREVDSADFSNQWPSYTSSSEELYASISSDTLDADVDTTRHRRDPHRDKKLGWQVDSSKAEVVYGKPTYKTGHSDVLSSNHWSESHSRDSNRFSSFKVTPRDEGQLTDVGSADWLSLESGSGVAHSGTARDADTSGVYTSGTTHEYVLDKTNSKFSTKIFADQPKKPNRGREMKQNLRTEDFSDLVETDTALSMNLIHNPGYFHSLPKASFKDQNDLKLQEPAPISTVSNNQKSTRFINSKKSNLLPADLIGTASSHSEQHVPLFSSLQGAYGGNLHLPQKSRGGGGGGGGGGGEGGKIHLLLIPEGDYKIYMPSPPTAGGVVGGEKKKGPTVINLTDGRQGRGHSSASAGHFNKLQLIQNLLQW